MNLITRYSMLAACCCASSLWAQVTTATYYATVTDSTGAVIPGAKVALIHDGTGTTNEKITDAQGEAVFTFLRVGAYTIRADAKGFKRQESTGLELTAGQQVRNMMSLEIGAATETVRVDANVPLINSVSSEQINSFEAIKIRELPLARRNFSALLSLGTGVVSTGDSVRMNGIGKSGVAFSRSEERRVGKECVP